jgi:predicted DNA-binding antitoxin AbrB/MazE fold protein
LGRAIKAKYKDGVIKPLKKRRRENGMNGGEYLKEQQHFKTMKENIERK